jgi:asparagine synthase (glutamine-hydrolysing)
MPGRYESYNLLDHIGTRTVFAPEFVATVDVTRPHALMREAHAPYAGASLINQMLGIDLRFTLADSDLPKVTRMCELAGIDVAFPMLDDDLVAFSGHLPSSYKLRGTQLRWFFKEALRDFLPPAVLTKKKHGFGLPVGVWLTTHRPLFDLACDALATLRTRGIFEPRFTAELTDRLLPQHPGYYGVMVWVMMILAIWLESRGL